MSRILASITMALCLGASLSAAAEDSSVIQQVRVAYGDLDLGRDAGVRALYGRLRRAADRACDAGSFRDHVDSACAARALDEAVASVGNDRLATLHARSTGRDG